jgi:hypothetical protein
MKHLRKAPPNPTPWTDENLDDLVAAIDDCDPEPIGRWLRKHVRCSRDFEWFIVALSSDVYNVVNPDDQDMDVSPQAPPGAPQNMTVGLQLVAADLSNNLELFHDLVKAVTRWPTEAQAEFAVDFAQLVHNLTCHSKIEAGGQ